MASRSTVSDLCKAGAVSDVEIDAAADAYLADRGAEPFRFADGHEIDVANAIEAHWPAKAAVSDDDRTPKYKRTMVRAAILLAHPVKG